MTSSSEMKDSASMKSDNMAAYLCKKGWECSLEPKHWPWVWYQKERKGTKYTIQHAFDIQKGLDNASQNRGRANNKPKILPEE